MGKTQQDRVRTFVGRRTRVCYCSRVGTPKTVLVADDEEPIRALITRVLGKKGYRLLLAADGVEALALFHAHREEIDAVVFDVRMPNLAGPDALVKILALRPGLPAVLMSGFTSDHDLSELLASGVRFVPKPLRIDVLADVVCEIAPLTA